MAVLALAVSLLAAVASGFTTSPAQQHIKSPTNYDVAVIGGGAGGMYAAVRLQQLGYSVLLLEKEDRLGGHVDTYQGPGTNKTFDYGVTTFQNVSVVQNLVEYLGVPLTPYVPPQFAFADLSQDGRFLTSLPASVPWANTTAAGLAVAGLEQQFTRLLGTASGINVTEPVPEDLLISTGDFLKKYGLEAAGFQLAFVCEGAGNVLAQPALYMLRCSGGPGGGTAMTTATHDNQGLYGRALAVLGTENVLLSSRVKHIDRDGVDCPVKLTVEIETETLREFTARTLIVSIPPTVSNFKSIGLDLSASDEQLLGKFNNSYYWDMVIRNCGIPNQLGSIVTLDLDAPLAIPPMPNTIALNPPETAGFDDLRAGYYSSPHYLSDEEVQADVVAGIKRVREANNMTDAGQPEFVKFHSHAPFLLTASVDEIRNGFYSKFYALQGQKNTFYSGAAWAGFQSTTDIWEYFEENVLEGVLATLSK